MQTKSKQYSKQQLMKAGELLLNALGTFTDDSLADIIAILKNKYIANFLGHDEVPSDRPTRAAIYKAVSLLENVQTARAEIAEIPFNGKKSP